MRAERPEAELRTELRSLGTGTWLGTFGHVAYGALELLFVVVVARGLGAEAAGVLFTSISVFMIVRSVLQVGPVTGLVRTVARHRATGRNQDGPRLVQAAVGPLFTVGALLAVVGWLVAPSLSRALVGGPEATLYMRVLAAFLPFATVVSALAAAGRGLGTMLPTTLHEQIGPAAMRVVLVLVTLQIGLGPAAIGVAWAIPFVVVLPFLGRWIQRLAVRDGPRGVAVPEPAPHLELARELWTFSAVRGLAALFRQTVRWVDIPLVAALASPEAAGVYAAASRLLMAGAIAIRGIGLAIGPQISRLVADGNSELARGTYRTATHWVMVISAPVYLALAAYPGLLLGIFGSGFPAGADALRIIALASLVNVATGPVLVVLLMEGRTGTNLLIAVMSVALNIGLNLLLIPLFGLEGAAIAWAVSIVAENVLPLVSLWRADGYHPVDRGFLLAILACATSYGVAGVLVPTLLETTARTGLLSFVTVGSALYGLWLWYARGPLELGALMQWMVGQTRGRRDLPRVKVR